MKKEKFCFNKGVGLIAIIGIVLIGFVLISQTLMNTQTSTNSRAARTSKWCLITKNWFEVCLGKADLGVCENKSDSNYTATVCNASLKDYVADNTSQGICKPDDSFLSAGRYCRLPSTVRKVISDADINSVVGSSPIPANQPCRDQTGEQNAICKSKDLTAVSEHIKTTFTCPIWIDYTSSIDRLSVTGGQLIEGVCYIPSN